MAAKLTAVQKREKGAEAVELSSKGWTNLAIAERISVTPKTVASLITDEYARRAEHRGGDDREGAIATYEAVISEGWDRLSRLKDNSNNVTGVLNAIRAAQERIDKLTGSEAPIKTQDVTEEYEILWADGEYADEDLTP